jgi:hypothetical protein
MFKVLAGGLQLKDDVRRDIIFTFAGNLLYILHPTASSGIILYEECHVLLVHSFIVSVASLAYFIQRSSAILQQLC